MYGDCQPSPDGRNRKARREELESLAVMADYRHRIHDIAIMEQEGSLMLGEEEVGVDLPFE